MSALTGYSMYLLSNIMEIKPIVAFISAFVLPIGQVGRGSLCWWTLVSQLLCGSFAGVARTARMSL